MAASAGGAANQMCLYRVAAGRRGREACNAVASRSRVYTTCGGWQGEGDVGVSAVEHIVDLWTTANSVWAVAVCGACPESNLSGCGLE